MRLKTSGAKFVNAGRCPAPLAFMVLVFAGTASAAASCESLSSLKLQDTTITAAEAVAAGAFAPPAPAGGKGGKGGGGNPYANLPAFCRVAATLKPSTDSDIKMEIWLPATGWNNKFEADGNGA